jgi:integrase
MKAQQGFVRMRGSTHTAYWSTIDPATGSRRQHSKGGFKTKTAARKHLNEIIGTVQDGSWRPDKALTVKQLLEEHWLPAKRSENRRPTTLAQYENLIALWLAPHIGGVRVASLSPKHVVELNDLLKSLSPRTRQLTVGTLKSATRWALGAGLLARDPLAGVRRPSVQTRSAFRPWDEEEARTFLTATADDRLAFAWALLLTRGLRRGELCGLRWDAIDLDTGTLEVSRTRVVVDGQPLDQEVTKTQAGRRTVPLDPSLVALLRSYRAIQAGEKLRARGGAYEDGGWLVCDELGWPCHPDTLSGWFDDRIEVAKLRRIRLHDCRHTAASLMLKQGVPVKVVSEMLGHSSIAITLGIYGHVMPGMAEEAGAALSASLLGG